MNRTSIMRVRLATIASAACIAGLSVFVANAALETRIGGETDRLETLDDGRGKTDDSAALAWVDPVVTGPISAKYREQREKAGCDAAVWPDIPTVCFPN